MSKILNKETIKDMFREIRCGKVVHIFKHSDDKVEFYADCYVCYGVSPTVDGTNLYILDVPDTNGTITKAYKTERGLMLAIDRYVGQFVKGGVYEYEVE